MWQFFFWGGVPLGWSNTGINNVFRLFNMRSHCWFKIPLNVLEKKTRRLFGNSQSSQYGFCQQYLKVKVDAKGLSISWQYWPLFGLWFRMYWIYYFDGVFSINTQQSVYCRQYIFLWMLVILFIIILRKLSTFSKDENVS